MIKKYACRDAKSRTTGAMGIRCHVERAQERSDRIFDRAAHTRVGA